jgi:hypothetical protein
MAITYPDIPAVSIDGDLVPNLIHDSGNYSDDVVNAKFAEWDRVVKLDLMNNPDEDNQRYIFSLLQDTTIYFYAFFRDMEGNPIKARSYQDLFFNCSNPRLLLLGSNQCIYEKEKVYIHKGKTISMKEIKVGQYVMSYDNGELVSKRVSWKSEPILKNCYRLKSRSGKELILSEDHPILTPSGWKSILQGVKVNNYKETNKNKFEDLTSMICVPSQIGNFQKRDRDKREVTVLAYMMTDGYFGRDGQTPKFTNNSELLLSEFEKDVLLFVPESKRYKKNKGFDIVASTGTRSSKVKNKLTLFLKELGLWKSKSERTFPENIWRYSKSDLALFINRLYACDGTIFDYYQNNNHSCRIMLFSPNKQFIEDLQELLLKFGIHSNIVIEKPTKKRPGNNIGYRLTCQNPRDIITFLDEIGDVYSKEEKCKVAREICSKQLQTFYDHRAKFEHRDFFWDYITVIEPVGIKTCYDISVEDTNNFIAKGVTVHNCGKSYSLCMKALHFALINPGKTVVMFSRSMIQSKDLIKQIKDLLKNSIIKPDIGETETKTEIYFKHYDNNGKSLKDSRILCLPATETGLGFAVDLELLDELAFYSEPDAEYFFYQVAQPRTYATKGQIIAFTNNNGKANFIYKLWLGDSFHKIRINYLDNPSNSRRSYDKLVRDMPQQMIDSTLLAKFTNSDGAYFTVEEINAMQEKRPNQLPSVFELNQPIYIFYDFAKVRDRTVRMCGIPTSERGVYVYEMFEYSQGTPYEKILQDLNDIITRYGNKNIAGVGYDATGVGTAIQEWISKIELFGVRTFGIKYSLQKKAEMCTLLKLLAERNIKFPETGNGVKVPEHGEFYKQMSKMQFKKTTSGQLMVHHENEADRDDFFDALIGLSYIMVNPENVPVTLTTIEKMKLSKLNLFDEQQCSECGCWLESEELCPNCGAKTYQFLDNEESKNENG